MITATAVKSIRELKNRHQGETIWIVGSGASLNFVDRAFFNDKTTVLVNETYREWRVDPKRGTSYAFAHHRETAQEGIDRGLHVIAAEYNRCDRADGKNDLCGQWYMYKHPQQPSTLVMDMTPFEQDDDEALCVGSNTVTSAMDFAGRILGASALILCGVDSGTIDGRINYNDYNGGVEVAFEEQQTLGGTGRPHVRAQLALLGTVTRALRARRIGVHSLNPFLDLGLERHNFSRL